MHLNIENAEGPFMLVVVLGVIATLVIHVAFALAVLSDANTLGARTALVGSLIWALATLLGGVFVAAIYWALNRSVLSPLYARQSLRTLLPELGSDSGQSRSPVE